MAIIKKFSPKENLNAFSTFVTDTNPNSDYFRITEFKETFTGGRNGFLIEGSEHLKETTEIKIEILDVNGDPIYFEPIDGVPEYYEGISKLIAVYVYNDTPIGQAKITVLGELKTYLEGGVVRDIPDDWKGVYNAKWERTFKVNKLLANEDRVRFNRKPKVQIEEIVKPIFNTSIPTVVQSGSVNGIPNVPLQNQTLTNYTQPTSYRLEIVGDGAWTGSVIGTTLEFGGIGYSPTVVDIINSKNIIVNPPYSVNNIVNSFTNEDYTASFQHIEGIVNGDTSLTGSFAKINITDLSTFVGDVARVKVFRKSKSNIGDFEFIQEIQLESNEILVDFNTIGKNEEFYGLFTDINIDEYWITSSNDITASFNQSYLYNSAKLDSNVGVQNFYTSNSLSIQEGVEYVLSFGVRSGLVSSPNYIQAFITGSRQSTLNGSPVTIQVRKDIVKINSTNFTLQKQDISQNFIAEKIDDAKLYFDVVGTDWYINNVSLKASQETAFSPDEITFIQPVPKTLQVETFDYKFEFYDINNNNIPINVIKTQTFTGGNTALLNRSLNVEPTNLFFTFDSASQSVGINVINFNIIRNLLTGSVTFTSGAFDASNTLIPSSSYVGQYPGLLTNISASSATLTAANFTGSDATHTVQFITYTALCENLTDNVTIGRVSNGVDGLAGASGSSAKLLDISVSSPGFSFDDVSDTEATPPTITVSIKQQNLTSAVLTSDISITGSDSSNITVPSLSGTIVSGTGTQTFIISFADSGAGGLSQNKGKLPLTINVVKDGILESTTILKLEGGSDAGPQYYLKPLTGTNLLNANGTLIVQASEILSSGESDVTSGPIKIFSGSLSGSQLSPLTGFTGSTDYFVSASSDAITGRLLLELKDETTGFVHDTIVLLDQYDGLGGGSIVANSLVTIRDKNNTYSINPIRATASFFDINVNEFRAEFRIEPNFNIGTLNDEMKFITDSVNENITLEFNDGDGVLMVNNSFIPTKDVVVIATFTDPNSGAVIKETETFYISSDGKDGLDGLQVSVVNQVEEVQCNSAGTPNEGTGPYTNTGTDIYVYEGTSSLQYTTSTPSDGEWTVASTLVVPNNITVGSITDGGDYAIVGNHSNLSADSVNINYNISGKRINGQSFAITGSQVVYKVFAGTPGLNGKVVQLSADSFVVSYDENGLNPTPPTSILLIASSSNFISGSFRFTGEGLSESSFTLGVTNNTDTASISVPFSYFPTPKTYRVGVSENDNQTVEIASDTITIFAVKPGLPGTPGDSAIEYKIVPQNGTQIKNSDGTLELQVVEISGSVLTTASFGDYKLASGSTFGSILTVGNGYTAGVNGVEYNPIISAEAISGSLTLFLITGSNGAEVIWDTITLVDVTDGLGGGSFLSSTLGMRRTANLNEFQPQFISATASFFDVGQGGLEYTSSFRIFPSYSVAQDVDFMKFETGLLHPSISLSFNDGDGLVMNNNVFASTKDLVAIATFTSPKTGQTTTTTETYYIISDGIDGADAYTVVLTNESHTLPANNAGGVSSFVGSGTRIIAYKGSTKLTGSLVTPIAGFYSASITTQTGITATQPYTIVNNEIVYGDHSNMTTPNASIEYTIFLEGTVLEVSKLQSFAKSVAGSNGADGFTITLSNEAVTLPTTVDGVVTKTGSGTTINVLRGNTPLSAVSGIPGAGQFTVSISSNSPHITPGSIIHSGTTATVADISTWSQSTIPSGSIVYDINVEGIINFLKTQSFALSYEGETGPGIVFRGFWTGSINYQYDVESRRRDAVLYDTGSTGVGVLTYYATLQPSGPPSTVVTPTGSSTFNSGQYWEELGVEDFFVAAKIAIFEESFVKNTLNVGNNPGNDKANIIIQGSGSFPFIAIGQTGSVIGYEQPGIFMGTAVNDGQDIQRFSIVSNDNSNSLKWDGEELIVSGTIVSDEGNIGGWSLSPTSLSQGNVNLLATNVSGGLFVTSGSERILTVGEFADVTVTTSPGIFATASLFRSTINGTATILSSSNSLTINRNTTITDNTFDTEFNPNANNNVRALVIQSDSKIVIGGEFTTVGGTTRNRIAKLNTDGTLDTGFNPNANSDVYSLAIQSDGKILIGGDFTTIGGTTRNRIARLNTDGPADTGFNPNVNGTVNALAIQSDGKILIGGAFTTVGGTNRNRVARLNTDGTLDTGFDPDVNVDVEVITTQSDGKIVIGGQFTTVGGTARNRIARLNTDGTLDTGFNPNANGTVRALAIQSDGKILIGGDFTNVVSTTRNRVAKLNTDGTLDTVFNPNANGTVNTIGIQSDGKILIGGTFTTIGGTTRNRIAKLNTDGTLDTGFNPNANGTVRALAIQSDGKILIGGDFTTIGGTTRNRIARLNTDGQYVTTNVTQSLGTIQAGRVIALEYNYADLTTYTSSAGGVGWNSTSFTTSSIQTFFTTTGSEQTDSISISTGSSTVSGVLNGARGVVSFMVSSSYLTTGLISADGSVSFTKGTLVLNSGAGSSLGVFNLNVPEREGALSAEGLTPITASLSYTSPTTIIYTASYDYTIFPAREGRPEGLERSVTSSFGISNLASTIYIPTEFTASISSSGGSQLLNTFKNSGLNDSLPYSKIYADTFFVPTTVTDAKLIFTVKQLGSGSAYTNLPSYQISDILLSTDLPKVNITKNQALFYNSPLQYMEWTTSSFDIKGDIDATSLTVRGTTNLLGPVNIEADISAHPNIQRANDTNFTAGTVIQNLTFDEFGHTTDVFSTNLDVRYQPVGSYVTTDTAQTISALKSIVLSSNPTLVLGVGPSAFSGSLEFRGTTQIGSQATSVIRIKPTAASSVVVDLPDAGGTMAMLEDIAITSLSSAANNRVITSDGGKATTAESNLNFDGTHLSIRTTDTGAVLTLKQDANNDAGGIRLINSADANFWAIFSVPPTSATQGLNFKYNGGANGGYLAFDTNVNNIDFTGQHRSLIGLNNNTSPLTPEELVGLIVIADGTYTNLDGNTEPKINEALPNVLLSETSYDKRVFGVISDKEDLSDGERKYAVGAWVSTFEISGSSEERLVINSLGEGSMWVCNYSGSFENGDYITTSPIKGLGMRQNDDILHNYTVGKITQDCDFNISGSYIEFEFSGSMYRKQFVGVTYHCG